MNAALMSELVPHTSPPSEVRVDWPQIVAAARGQLGFTAILKLGRQIAKLSATALDPGVPVIKLAILSSATTEHLAAGLRVAAARRGMLVSIYQHAYGLALQELNDPDSGLAQFHPDVVLLSFPADHLLKSRSLARTPEIVDEALAFAGNSLSTLRQLAREKFNCSIIQQLMLPTALPLIGQHEYRLPGSPAQLIAQLNDRLKQQSVAEQFAILDMEQVVLRDGLTAWHDRGLWYRAKQEISPAATLRYGDLVMQVIDAQRGRAAKCLVLDLDNTLWGGVIGDDGLDGIVLGQGNALGEAYVAFQTYAKLLSERGIVLAVVSKNDEQNALLPFLKHSEMVLRPEDISCFIANWTDKASNLREVARRLNIGLDALVFCDDNPFEREQVRAALPEVRVPELPEDPTYYADALAAAGYFESTSVTAEDYVRVAQYRENASREQLKASAGNIDDYLRSLDMELEWALCDVANSERITQLINKTNQFNLTTRRYDLSQVQRFMTEASSAVFSFRLRDRLGDNGIIGVIIGQQEGDALSIDSWLMSCRVLGRGVEKAMLMVIAAEAARRGATRLLGRYIPTEKNRMVAEHYAGLAFARAGEGDGATQWSLDLATYSQPNLLMKLKQVRS